MIGISFAATALIATLASAYEVRIPGRYLELRGDPCSEYWALWDGEKMRICGFETAINGET